jgi:sporulation protein YlmC with PRC-barrel domain
MLRSIKSLYGYTIQARDGDIGKVQEFYFDDQAWTIRYLVVDTGGWLLGRRVLLSTVAAGQPEWEKRAFPAVLTKEQVEHSPSISADKPVSRQMEEDLHTYYGWTPYWSGAGIAMAEAAAEREKREAGDPHLRSTQKVTGYHIQATDGEIGHVEDFVVDDETWVIRYMVVNTRNWLPGKSVLVAPTWVDRISWAGGLVYLDLDRETIKNSPEFDPSAPVNRAYELRLYDYYGRPKYWTQV